METPSGPIHVPVSVGAVNFPMKVRTAADAMTKADIALRDAKQLVRMDLSATMLWNNPSISKLSAFVAELLAPMQQAAPEPEADDSEEGGEEFSVLDELFDSIESSSVESANAGSEGAI